MTPAQEERFAANRDKRLAKARATRARNAAVAQRARMREVMAQTKSQHPHCSCKIKADMDRAALISLGSGCAERFVCPRLDRVRRAAGI